jgi:hypothetical protein
MNAQGKFISFMLIVDTFLVGYAYGFNSRKVLVIDPKLPPLVVKPAAQAPVKEQKPPEKTAIAGEKKKEKAPDKAKEAATAAKHETQKPAEKQPSKSRHHKRKSKTE